MPGILEVRRRRFRRGARLAAALVLPLPCLATVSALAEVVSVDAPSTTVFANDWGTFGEAPKPRSGPPKPNERDYSFQIGDWLVHGVANVGAVYNDNLYGTNTNRVGSWGFGVAPSLLAERNTGLFKTTLYGGLNADFYDSNSNADTVTGRAGLVNVWEIQRDLTWRAQFDYYRDVYYPGGAPGTTGTSGPVASPEGMNQFFGSTGLHKDFGQMFADIGGSVTYTTYADPSAASGQVYNLTSPDGLIYTATGRIGYNLSPVIYVFVEPRLNWWQYTNSLFDSTGYRLVGGLGTDRISLFRGEIFAGYQSQDFGSASLGTVDSPVVGGAVSWFPTRDLTFKLTADQTIAVSTPSLAFSADNVGFYDSYVTKNTAVGLTGTYTINRQWSSNAGLTYTHSDYVGQPRVDDQYGATVGVTYMMLNNWGINLSYTYTNVDSNIPTDSYTQNVTRISARGQF
ncbi:outer membrane beta-barrel protein [Azorhizobium doebereinerae]|uniref:outer membrane beta-barrel protein n=1 Tax=Azorhizobium doebereinerae TaxID=281091 RepID=UPI0004171BEF|nr:outer membrane beta-barrel protein [Azorhizobium doebereinerae]